MMHFVLIRALPSASVHLWLGTSMNLNLVVDLMANHACEEVGGCTCARLGQKLITPSRAQVLSTAVGWASLRMASCSHSHTHLIYATHINWNVIRTLSLFPDQKADTHLLYSPR